jgi:dTDP-4-dehydrorhamnose reductase
LALAPPHSDLVGTGGRRPVRPGAWRDCQLDLTSPAALGALIEREQPGIIFFCAHERGNRAATVEAPARAAALARKARSRFVFFSTDLVFDGRTGGYREIDRPAPLLLHGVQKAEAELQVRAEHPGAIVIRSSLFTGESGVSLRPSYECENLVRGLPVTLYRDEWRTPVHVDDLVRAAWDLVGREFRGIFHVAGPDRLSRFELGKLLCALYHFDPALLREGARPADRPGDTSLDCRYTTEILGWAPRSLVELAQHAPAAALAYA